MVQFETLGGAYVLVNPDHVKVVKCDPKMIGTFRLVLEFFPIEGARGFTIVSHSITVKADSMNDLRRKLEGDGSPMVLQ